MADPTERPGPLGTGEGEAPLVGPSPQNVALRTMASDIASIQSSGGGQPRSYTPPPPPPRSGTPLPPPPSFSRPTPAIP
ncbi:MAG: hypothetical protein AAB601_00990, partial [Patescibacteria group bacterium]